MRTWWGGGDHLKFKCYSVVKVYEVGRYEINYRPRIEVGSITNSKNSQQLNMKFNDLTLALVITSNVIISCQSAPYPVVRKEEFQPHKLNLSERKHNRNELLENYYYKGQEFLKRPKRVDLKKWNIRAIQIQLDIIIDRYHVVNKKIQDLYFGVIGCGMNGCQNFEEYIPKIKHEPNTKIFTKRRRHLGKKIYELLQTFHSGLQKISNSYGAMLKYENSSGLYNKVRSELLQVFKRDVKVLNVEVEAAMSVKNTEIVRENDSKAYDIFRFPSNHSDLIIQEWYIIQSSKNFLIEWRKILDDLETQVNTLKISQSRRSKKKRMKKAKKMRKKKTNLKSRKSRII